MTEIAIVVPWRSGVPERERAWAWARPWWERFGWPIHVVEHAGDDPFNRAWCINEGARRAWPWDVLIAIDADVFEDDPDQVVNGVRSASETGRLTIPHTIGADLNQRGTSRLLAGQAGWETMRHKTRPVCTSRVWIMPRSLFLAVQGFDSRHRGWGHEDVSAFHAMRTLRGCDQLPGTCYHLWHAPSFPRARRTAEWEEGQALAQRYLTADRQGWPAIAPILGERTEDERFDPPTGPVTPADGPAPARLNTSGAVDVIVLTAGRQDYLEATLASFRDRVHGPIARVTIYDDSGNRRFANWLRRAAGDYDIVTMPGRSGFTRAIRNAWEHERRRSGGSPYIMHLEEDFTFDVPVNVTDMIAVLQADTHLAQVALLRGPFFPPEIAAGGIIQEHPESYERAVDGEATWLVHDRFFTTNPCIYRRSLMRYGWPNVRNSEVAFTKSMRRRGYRFAFLGDGTPMVSHIGVERTNLGY